MTDTIAPTQTVDLLSKFDPIIQTRETLLAAGRAASAQYKDARSIEHIYPLIRTDRQLTKVFAEIEALLQRAGYHRQLDVVGYQGLAYALFDPARWEAVEVLRWLRDFVEEARVQPAS